MLSTQCTHLCPYHCHKNTIDEMNVRIAYLTNEGILHFLHDSFDRSREDEIKDIKPELLLQADSFGQTILHLAASKGDVEVTAFMIPKTGDEVFNSQTKYDGYTALHLAIYGNNDEIVNLLIENSKERGLNYYVNITNAYGQTALHIAANYGYLHACEVLYDNMSADEIALGDKQGQTALHLAVKGGYAKIVTLLLSKDENVENLLVKVDMYNNTALHCVVNNSSNNEEELVRLLIDKVITLNE